MNPAATSSHSKRLTLGQHQIYYEQSGQGPPLLLIHGLSGSSSWWRRNVAAFAPHFTVYSIDLVGFGRNRRLRPLTLPAAADLLAVLIEALGHERASLVGHSMGGHISLLLAVRHPERVDRLVLAAAAPGKPAMSRGMPEMMARALMAGFRGIDFVPTVLWDALQAGPLGLWVAARELLGADLSELVTAVRAPTLLIWGDRDLLVPLEVGEALHTMLPGSTLLVLEGAGHVLMFDRAAAFNKAVLSFLLGQQS